MSVASTARSAASLAALEILHVLATEMFPELTHHSVSTANDREGWNSGRAAADLAALHGHREVADDPA
jgi:hypothetical protein